MNSTRKFLVAVIAHLPLVLFLGLLSGCASSPTNADHEALNQGLETQKRCWDAWGKLVHDWSEHGGGFQRSMLETRAQVARDQRAPFAKLVREVWQQQDSLAAEQEFGYWPIAHDQHVALSSAILLKSKGYVPQECTSAAWLDGVLWDELRSGSGDVATASRLTEVPAAIEWVSPYAQQWAGYWLFVRTTTD